MRNNRPNRQGQQPARTPQPRQAPPVYTTYPTVYPPKVTYYPPVRRRRGGGVGQFLRGFVFGYLSAALMAAALAVALIFLFPTGRTNILILGVDRRPEETTFVTRTDTMMLTTVYAQERYIGMLSIPRDLWLLLPQGFEGRVNTAHFFAEANAAGTGPGAAMDVVRSNFGVVVDHYVRVDLVGFVRIVDAMGGVDLEVPNALIDYEYPTYDYGTRVVAFAAGPQHMDGEVALAYARIRHGSSDFQRAERQQLVIQAMLTRLMQPSAWVRLPAILAAVNELVDTDLSAVDVARLAPAVLLVGPANIDREVIEGRWCSPSPPTAAQRCSCRCGRRLIRCCWRCLGSSVEVGVAGRKSEKISRQSAGSSRQKAEVRANA